MDMGDEHYDLIHSALTVADKMTHLGQALNALAKDNAELSTLFDSLLKSLGATTVLAAEVRRYRQEELARQL